MWPGADAGIWHNGLNFPSPSHPIPTLPFPPLTLPFPLAPSNPFNCVFWIHFCATLYIFTTNTNSLHSSSVHWRCWVGIYHITILHQQAMKVLVQWTIFIRAQAEETLWKARPKPTKKHQSDKSTNETLTRATLRDGMSLGRSGMVLALASDAVSSCWKPTLATNEYGCTVSRIPWTAKNLVV